MKCQQVVHIGKICLVVNEKRPVNIECCGMEMVSCIADGRKITWNRLIPHMHHSSHIVMLPQPQPQHHHSTISTFTSINTSYFITTIWNYQQENDEEKSCQASTWYIYNKSEWYKWDIEKTGKERRRVSEIVWVFSSLFNHISKRNKTTTTGIGTCV